MKILLLKDVKNLGSANEVAEVSEGYARNMLIPQKLAVPATPAILADVKKKHEAAEAREAKARAEAVALKEKLGTGRIIVKAKAGSEGKLYGAVTAAEVAEAIDKAFGVELDRKKVSLNESVKHLGIHTAHIRLHAGVSADISFEVVAEEE